MPTVQDVNNLQNTANSLLTTVTQLVDKQAGVYSYTNVDQLQQKLNAEQTDILNKISEIDRKTASLNKDFLENIYPEFPTAGAVPTLQDLALLIFWIGWVSLIVVLLAVRFKSPGFDWKIFLLILSLLLFTTVMVYALLRQLA
jgi:hypothetical protein